LRHGRRPFKKKRKLKVVSKTLKSIRLVVLWYIEQQIQKEFVRVTRRYTRVIFFAVVQC